jgi:hypothetical protein
MYVKNLINSKKNNRMNLGNLKKKYRHNVLRRMVYMWMVLLTVLAIASGSFARPVFLSHHITMVQGDDPSTDETESESEIYVLESFSVLIPWNESGVQVAVPLVSKSWNVDQVIYLSPVDYIPGEYSAFHNPTNPPFKQFIDMTGMDCCYAHRYAWGFPEGADRNVTDSTSIDSDVDFIQYFDNTRSDVVWNFSTDGLYLKPGNTSGDFISFPLTVPLSMAANITKIEMSWNISMHEENISIFVSNNNGTDWMNMNGLKGQILNFSTQGTELLWKINMTQDINLNNTPILDDLWINVSYIPIYTNINLNVEYTLERNPNTNRFDFTLDMYDDYIDYVTPHMLIYINNDHVLESRNITLTFTESPENLPDKDRYNFMVGDYLPVVEISVQKIEEEGEFPLSLLLALLLIVLIIAILIVSRARKKESEEEPYEDEEPVDQEEKLKKMQLKKEGLVTAISKLDSDFEEGLIDEDVHSELKGSYEEKAADMNQQIVALSAITSEEEPVISSEKAALLEKKEKILKSIKKLDSDYEEGLLDEDVYQDLRQSYKGKAVEVMKELEGN